MAPRDRIEGVALVTGGGRGIGAGIARELADAGMKVAVTGRTQDQVEAVAADVGGLALTGDVARAEDVESWVERTESELGPITVLVANAGVGGERTYTWNARPEEWWRVFEVNVLGVFLCCRTVIPRMAERGGGRIVVTGSGASYLPMSGQAPLGSAYGSSKAAVGRFVELLAGEAGSMGIHVFLLAPGLVKTAMTEDIFPETAPWTPPELAPQLVRVLASGRADALAGRYLHAEHDDVEQMIPRAAEIAADDLNAIRLRR